MDQLDASGAAAPAKKKGGLMGVVLPLLLLTAAAGGGGSLIGLQIVKSLKGPAKPDGKAPPAVAEAVPDTSVKELTPIVTNLAAPDGAAWIRLQTAIVYDKSDGPHIDLLATQIADDTLAFVRTLNLQQIQGAAGLQHLREDLNERASIRSDGHVREMMIETLVIQ